MDAISREHCAGLAFARQQRPAGSAVTGVALSNTPDNRTESQLCLSGSFAGLAIMRRARRVARWPTETPPSRGQLCGNDQRTPFAGGGEPTGTGAQANLRLPGDGANRFGQPLEPRLQGLADAGRMPVAPGTLDQDPAGTFVAGQCETGAPNPLASRPLGRHQAEKGHQLARIVEPPQIADFRDKRDGHSKGDAAHRLIGFDHGAIDQPPGLEPIAPQ